MKNTLKGFQRFLRELQNTEHKELEREYGIDISVAKHAEKIIQYLWLGRNIIDRRFGYQLSGQLLPPNFPVEEKIKVLAYLHDVNELNGYNEDEEPEEKNEDEEIEISDERRKRAFWSILKKFFGDEIKQLVDSIILDVVMNHDIDFSDDKKLEKLFYNNKPEFAYVFMTFMLAHDASILSCLTEFKGEEDDDEEKISCASPLNNTDAQMVAVELKYRKALDIMEKVFLGKSEDNGKLFTAKAIIINKLHNNEFKTEGTFSADVAPGIENAGSALRTNLFDQTKKARKVYKQRIKDNSAMIKRAKNKGGFKILSPTTFNTILGIK